MRYDNFIRLSAIAFLVAVIGMFFLPKEWRSLLYRPGYLGTIFFVSAFLIYLPQIIFSSRLRKEKYLVKKIQAVLALALLLNAAGELGAYKLHLIGFEFDKFIHLINSMLFAVVLGEALVVWKIFSPHHNIQRLTILAVFLAGVGWEVWEMVSDQIFDTLEWGVYGENISKDTFGDIMWNLVGTVLGTQIKFKPRKKPSLKKYN